MERSIFVAFVTQKKIAALNWVKYPIVVERFIQEINHVWYVDLK